MDQSTIEQLQAAAMRNEIDWEINGVPVKLHKLYIDDLIELSGNILLLINKFTESFSKDDISKAAKGQMPDMGNMELFALETAGIIKPIIAASMLDGKEPPEVKKSLETLVGKMPVDFIVSWILQMKELYGTEELKRLRDRFFGPIWQLLGKVTEKPEEIPSDT